MRASGIAVLASIALSGCICKDGGFDVTYMTGLAWGGCKPLGIGIERPETPAVDEVDVYFVDAAGRWALLVSRNLATGEPELVDLGTVQLGP
jgi:hypothetical protein